MTRQTQGQGEWPRSAACARSLGAQLRECAPAVGGDSPPAWRSVAGGRCVSAHLFQEPPLHLQNLLRPGPVVGHVRHYPAPPSRTVTCCREGGKAGESGAVVGGGRGGQKASLPATHARPGRTPAPLSAACSLAASARRRTAPASRGRVGAPAVRATRAALPQPAPAATAGGRASGAPGGLARRASAL